MNFSITIVNNSVEVYDFGGKKSEKSISYLNRAKNINETAEVFYDLGFSYYLNKDINKANESYERCLSIDNLMASAHLNISDFVAPVEAMEHLDKAIELDNTMYQAYGKKGELLRNIGLYSLAVRYFEKCLELDKQNYQSLQGISLSLLDLGRAEEAIIYLAEWLKIYKSRIIPKDMSVGKSTEISMPYGDVHINLSEGRACIAVGCIM